MNMKQQREELINAGRLLVCGTQGGGKTALVTNLAARTDKSMSYQEDFGGTIETEYLRIAFNEGKFFSLLLPVGGQEKWKSLRERFGSTAEGVIIILDSCTKKFWMNSLSQASDISTVIPYENYPITFVVTKRDLNDTIRNEVENFAKTIIDGLEEAKTTPLTYYSRGFRITERKVEIGDSLRIPFATLEQLIINSLEAKYFTGLVPGDAKKGKTLLPGFSLVNCRLFSRALAQELCGSTGGDQMAVLGLLNDMRPSMLELDASWTDLLRKYPRAGEEPSIEIQNLSEEAIKNTILDNLLASDEDIENFMTELNTKATVTGWKISGHCHVSIFEDEGLDISSSLIKKMMEDVKDSVRTDKFTLFDPIEEIF
jgi:GTPase SAR1 family protein